MKACVLHAVGDLRYEDAPQPEPGPGEALIQVAACGVCGSDIPRVFEKGTYRFPTIPGHEFAGRVAALGQGVDEAWLGRAAAVFPLIPCQKCAPCQIGAYAQCEAYDYLGSRCDGAFAQYVCAPAWNLVPVPETLSLEEAAMAEPAAVALHALRQARLDAGDAVAVYGAGPIGLMLAMWARALGAGRVLLVDIDPAKLEFARALGFEACCNGREHDAPQWVAAQTGRGADVAVEASGSAAAFEQSVLSARAFGRVVLMGNPAGAMQISQKAYWAILRNELEVRGTWNSVYAGLPKNEWALALESMAAGRIGVKPLITHRVSLSELPEALVMLRDRAAFANKVMLVNP